MLQAFRSFKGITWFFRILFLLKLCSIWQMLYFHTLSLLCYAYFNILFRPLTTWSLYWIAYLPTPLGGGNDDTRASVGWQKRALDPTLCEIEGRSLVLEVCLFQKVPDIEMFSVRALFYCHFFTVYLSIVRAILKTICSRPYECLRRWVFLSCSIF